MVLVIRRDRGIRDGVPSSVLSKERFEPCLEGGLEPVLLAGRDDGLDGGPEPPGVKLDLPVEAFLNVDLGVANEASLSLKESGVPADSEERDALDAPIGTDLADLSRTLVIGPAEPITGGVFVEDLGVLDLNAVMLCDTPSARMNCSLNSMFVRPLALQGSFLTRNSSKATQPPPTLTITVERRILTRRSF